MGGYRSGGHARDRRGDRIDRRNPVAAFDLDGTLTRGDTLLPFLRAVCGTLALTRALVATAPRVLWSLFVRRDRDRAKEIVLGATLANRSLESAMAAAAAHADRIVRSGLRDDVLAHVERHRRDGHELVLVSASPEIYVRLVGERLGFDHVIATRLESRDGKLTGRFAGSNVRSEAKAQLVRAHLDGRQVELWAYGDSPDDRALLALAAHPIAIAPATARGGFLILGATLAALVLLYFGLHRDHGYHPTDDGWILALAWRIANGEVPYRDFVWARPPLTPYMHSVWFLLPDGWQMQAGRLAFYAEMALTALLPALAAIGAGIARPTARLAALVGTGLVVALHNFPPMPWYTADGLAVAYGALAAFIASLATRSATATRWRALASLGLGLAVLAKQSFAVLPILLVLYAVAERWRGRPWSLLLATVAPGAAIGLVVVLAMLAQGAIAPMSQQLAAASSLDALVRSGIEIPLGRFAIEGFFIFTLLGIALVALGDPRLAGRALQTVRTLAVVGALGVVAVLTLDRSDQYHLKWGPALFWLGVGLLVGTLVRRREQGTGVLIAMHAGVVAVAASSAISWGYQSPILAIAPVALLLELALPRRVERLDRSLAFVTLAVALFLFQALIFASPYREAERERQVADLGAIFPRFGHLYTNAENADRFRELRDLIARHQTAGPFAVMPEFSLAYFLANTRNPLPVDWYYESEYVGNDDRILAALDARRPSVLVLREPSEAIGLRAVPRCDELRDLQALPRVARAVAGTWSLVEEGNYFCVYRRAAD